ncbi:MAG: protein phosphatase 2C domain-containing protein [Thiohalocapsa sp.]|nr:protein phosphatase 2C domain-containing protein [Thiohalocapsa sp.]
MNTDNERLAHDLIDVLLSRIPVGDAEIDAATKEQLLNLARQMVTSAQAASAGVRHSHEDDPRIASNDQPAHAGGTSAGGGPEPIEALDREAPQQLAQTGTEIPEDLPALQEADEPGNASDPAENLDQEAPQQLAQTGSEAPEDLLAQVQAGEPGGADDPEEHLDQEAPLQLAKTGTEVPDDQPALEEGNDVEDPADPAVCLGKDRSPPRASANQVPPEEVADPTQGAAIDRHRRPGVVPTAPLPRAEPQPRRMHVTIASNANAGESYSSTISVRDDTGRPARILSCEIPPEAGVDYCDGLLSGEAPHPGEYSIVISCANSDAESPLTVGAELIVNHDPRSLWQNKPSDRDAPGWKPDEQSLGIGGAGNRRLVAASVRGRSHAHSGGFRDDDVALRVSTDGAWNILAVADGAGSASRSRIGSRVATNVALDFAEKGLAAAGQAALDHVLIASQAGAKDKELTYLRRGLFYQTLGGAALEAVKAIEQKAQEHGMEARDYATTLLIAVHTHTAIGDVVGTYWVGDGAIAFCDRVEGARLLGEPDSGEFSGQTRFLDRNAVRDGDAIMGRIQCAITPELDALFLMSDGVSDPRFASDVELKAPERWLAFWEELQPLANDDMAPEKLRAWLQFWSKGHHDDRTIALLF